MKKILVLTSNYPASDLPKGITPVVHSFTKKWVEMGFEVLVIHNYTIFPRFYYLISRIFNKYIANKVGSVIPKELNNKITEYTTDNVKIIRIPIKKYLARKGYSLNEQNNQLTKIISSLVNENFVPEIIISHWTSPQLSLSYCLKRYYGTKSVMVMHEVWPEIIKRDYNKNAHKFIADIDYWGFRSKTIEERFNNIFGEQQNSFLCYSGINKDFIEDTISKNFDQNIKSYIFIGTLIKRKHPEVLINATKSLNNDSEIHFVGTGALESKLKQKAKDLGLFSRVYFHGYLSKKAIKELLITTDCFIMLSEEEAYGLVYIEAMACGCITIASKNEGFDGIIIDGVNGFLCTAGDSNELKQLLERINQLSIEQKQQISKNAISTAKNLTEQSVASNFLKSIELL